MADVQCVWSFLCCTMSVVVKCVICVLCAAVVPSVVSQSPYMTRPTSFHVLTGSESIDPPPSSANITDHFTHVLTTSNDNFKLEKAAMLSTAVNQSALDLNQSDVHTLAEFNKKPMGLFECLNGNEIITADQICDGVFQCLDKSDENYLQCLNLMRTPRFQANRAYVLFLGSITVMALFYSILLCLVCSSTYNLRKTNQIKANNRQDINLVTKKRQLTSSRQQDIGASGSNESEVITPNNLSHERETLSTEVSVELQRCEFKDDSNNLLPSTNPMIEETVEANSIKSINIDDVPGDSTSLSQTSRFIEQIDALPKRSLSVSSSSKDSNISLVQVSPNKSISINQSQDIAQIEIVNKPESCSYQDKLMLVNSDANLKLLLEQDFDNIASSSSTNSFFSFASSMDQTYYHSCRDLPHMCNGNNQKHQLKASPIRNKSHQEESSFVHSKLSCSNTPTSVVSERLHYPPDANNNSSSRVVSLSPITVVRPIKYKLKVVLNEDQ